STRQKEIAIRVAMGATRWRLLRQLLTESLVLALAGAAGGLVIASWFTKLLMSLQPPGPFPLLLGARIDPRVLVFTLIVSTLTGLVFGLAPALQASRPEVYDKLKEGGRGSDAAARGGTRRALVVAEVALAVVALAATGLLVRNLREATAIDPGFRPERVLTVNLDVSLQGYDEAHGAQFFRQFLERIQSQPGIRSATLASRLPLAAG